MPIDFERAEQALQEIYSQLSGLRIGAPEDTEARTARLKRIMEAQDVIAFALGIGRIADAQRIASADLQRQRADYAEALGCKEDEILERMRSLRLLATFRRIVAAEIGVDPSASDALIIGKCRAAGRASEVLADFAAALEAPPHMATDRTLVVGLATRYREAASSYEKKIEELALRVAAFESDIAGIEIALHGVFTDTASLVDRVTQLVKERRELLAEMVRDVTPEAVHIAGVPTSAEPDEEPAMRLLCSCCKESLCKRCGECHNKQGCVVAEWPCPDSDDEPVAPPAVSNADVAAALDAAIAVCTTSMIDWGRFPELAWFYAVIVGWSSHELDDLQMTFNWSDEVVETMERHRQALRAARQP